MFSAISSTFHIMYKVKNGLAPPYIVDLFSVTSS